MKKNDIVIIGSGPAGLTCSIYASRAGLSPIVLSGKDPGGQLTKTSSIENFPGFESINGADLMMKMIAQAESCGTQMIFENVEKLEKLEDETFKLLVSDGNSLLARSVVVATGALHKKLGVTGEEAFTNKGVSWCSTCDGPIYKGKKVAVIGGGNSALTEAEFLSQMADTVFLIHRRDSFRADKIMCQRVSENPKIKIIWDSVVKQIDGDAKVTGIVIENIKNKTETLIEVDGVFIAIGTKPATDFVKGIVDLDDEGYIMTKDGVTTSCKGIFAAGDVVSNALKQAVYAAGSGALAACQAEQFLRMGANV